MGGLYSYITLITMLLGMVGFVSLSQEPSDQSVDADVLATYFDGPKVRPGVALAISVTATGTQGQAAKQYFVDADGYIAMELVGQIKCDGLTLVGLQQKITAAYKEFFLDPHVTATFIYQAGGGMVSPWGTVTVLGEVNRPGPVDVPSTMDLRVTRALQLAGGATGIADKRNIRVTRCDKDGKQTKTIVNLIEIGEDGRPDKDMLLKAGDVVWVPMSWY
jgi:protein involved in polysaccharide export with SLBB domain